MYYKGKWIENKKQVLDLTTSFKQKRKQIIKTKNTIIAPKPKLNLVDMEIVYVFDHNYIKYFNESVKSVLKYNPNAHITVVSNEHLDIPYDVVVIDIPDNLKHRENDRISSATYLKLHLPKLPYDKVLFIDADVICQAPLDELWNTPCDYICLTESHTYGDKQALEHNHEKYGLSGVMLMNLKALREDNFTEKCFVPFDYSPFKIWCHEETIINHYFYDKLTFVDRKFNYCHNRIYTKPIPESRAVLLHYCGGNKSGMFNRVEEQPPYYNLQEIKDFIRGKRVALVGNAQSIFSLQNGELIDTFDLIIRFTYGFITVPESQGTKTDIVIMANELTSSEMKSYNASYYINRMKRFTNPTPHHFLNPDIVRTSENLSGARASSGLIAIDFCIESGCKSIDLFGFDWEKTPTFYNPIGYKTLHSYNDEENKVKNYYSSKCQIKVN